MSFYNLNKITIDQQLLQATDYKLALGVTVNKVRVEKYDSQLWQLIHQAQQLQKQQYHDINANDILPIKALRATYQKLGLKLADYKGSNEALLKRIVAEKELYQINTIVDINNYVSICSLRSIGSYDLAKIQGSITFRIGQHTKAYTGTTKRVTKLNNLPVLVDDYGPFGSPTTDSDRALITAETTDIMTIIYSFDGQNNLEQQLTEINSLFKQFSNASLSYSYIVS